jgi:DNA polymerase-4
MPSAVARRLCPDAVFVPGDMKRYARESKRIFTIFRRWTPLVEGLSFDEAFLDLTGTERLLGAPAATCAKLRAAVRDETGLAVSVGIAPSKLVAKIASDLAKPDGLLEVASDGVREFLAPLPVGRLWGVGPVAEARLQAAGFRTLGDLARTGAHVLEARLGEHGPWLGRLARGEDAREVDPRRAAVSIGEENTFERDVSDPRALETAALAHAEAVARRLRVSGLRARTVVLKLKLGRRIGPGPRGFPLLTRRCALPTPSDDGEALASAARRLLVRAAVREPVRLLGIAVTGLEPASQRQLGLFDPPEVQRRDRLNRALDDLTKRFGADAVWRAGAPTPQRAGLHDRAKLGENDGEEDDRL